MRARFLTVDGCDASGTTHHADALAAALRSHGFAARAYHHPKHPPGCVGVARVAWYMGARAQMLADDEREAATARALGDRTPRVIVLDRGPMSGVVYAESLHSSDPGRVAARRLAAEEREREPWRSAPTAVLAAGVEATEHVPSGAFWANARAAVKRRLPLIEEATAADERPCECVFIRPPKRGARDTSTVCTCLAPPGEGHALWCARVLGEKVAA